MFRKFSIKLIQPSLFLSENVAIVGSSGILNDSSYGKEIDLYEDVVRFNRSPTTGFEEQVGSKTTVRVVNCHVFRGLPIGNNLQTGQPTDFVKKLRNTNIVYYGQGSGPAASEKKQAEVHESNKLFSFRFDWSEKEKQAFGLSECNQLSVGFGMIFLCVISGIKPAVFGFDIEDGRFRDHYWEKKPAPGGCHNIVKEKEMLRKLINENRIKYFK